MPYSLNLASMLIRVRDIDDHPVIASTDGHRVRVLIRDADNPATDWRYADLALRSPTLSRRRSRHDTTCGPCGSSRGGLGDGQ
ncbi:hypothetical protein OIE68_00460 [Nocardia vinacea]|uniref:hypothetical protein n=1 Tax=Nocardia vinacea TaxID=96468 RepID=UPI002E11EF93|nr:hypothetical protein OIE68_00460 [Nocardia vinacea]